MLIHLLTLGNGPEPVSPMLLYLLLSAAAFKGNRELCPADSQIDLGALYELDAEIAEVLRPWMVLGESDPLTGFTGMPQAVVPVQFLLNRFDFQVCTGL